MIFGLFGGDKKRVAQMIEAARSGDTETIKQLLSKGANINAPEPDSGDTPLLAAIDKGQWAAAELLLEHHPDLSVEDKNNNSPLYLAVSRGDSALPMVNSLLKAGANTELGPSRGDNAGATPLYLACAIGANECIESLLLHGASATKQLPNGGTPLHTAAIAGDQRTIDLLCAAGGNVSALNDDQRTPLHNCGITGNAVAAAALIEHGAAVDDTDAEGCTPLMRAVLKNHPEVAQVLLNHGADPDVIFQTGEHPLYPLFVAAMSGYDEIVRILLDKGANVTAKVDGVPSPLDAAKQNGHEVSAKLITAAIKRKKAAEKESQGSRKEMADVWSKIVATITQRDNDSLREFAGAKQFSSLPADARLLVACVLGDIDLARSSLLAGASANHWFPDVLDGITPLVASVGLSRSLGVVQLLLDSGADVNQTWSEGITPVFDATTDQSHELAKLLVSKGANVNVRLNNGLTPLIYATRNGATKSVDLFLDAGADINAVGDEHGIGAFGWALNRLDVKLAEHLFDRGAEPNFGSIETLPLAIAEHGSLAFIRALEEKGCKLVRDDQRGRMAFISARNPDPEVFDYLLNHGADPRQGNDFGYTPLILAALNNRPALIRRYLERGDDANARDIDGETALSLALENRNNEAVAALREFHVEEQDYSELTPNAAMLKAAEDGALGTIMNLRDDGIAVNLEDEEGNTPLMLAVKSGCLGVIRSLYHLGADINHRNHEGKTALAIAKAFESTDVVNSLQEFGALDSMDGELGKLSNMFGGIAVFNAADTLFGRMSHPYKDKPPYDNPESDSETDSDETEGDQEYDASSDSVESKLEQIGQVLDNEEVREQLPEAVIEQLMQKMEHWRVLLAESAFGDEELVDLNELLDMLGLGQEKIEEVTQPPLFEAVNAQDLSAVKKLVKSGSDINEVDGEGNTALLIAVLTRQQKIVEELLKLGADPRKARPDGKGPLFGAVRVGEEQICQLLLKAGAEVDAPFEMDHNETPVGGCTALYVAATLGQLSTCKVLLGSGAQVDVANDIGYTPLMAALDGGHEDVINLLLKSGASVNPAVIARMDVKELGGATPLFIATRKEDLASIRKLLKAGVDVNRPSGNGWTPLKSAAQQGSLGILKVLLEAGSDPNIADNTNYTPLMNAVSGEHEAIVKLLLKFRADPNIQSGDNPEDEDWEPGRTALMDAAVSGNVPIARELLKQGANPNLLNSKGWTALHSAVISASADMVSLLLKSGADVDIYGNDEERLSALDLALRRWASEDEDERDGGISDVLELMLKKGMPTDPGTLNETALDLVAEGHLEVVKLLRTHGFVVDPNYSRNGASQLFIIAAVGDDRLRAAELLLQIGADANYKSPVGLSVLSLATRNGAVRLAELLLKAGANVMDRNSANALAYDLAVIYGHDELLDLLIKHMNQVVPAVDMQADDGTTALMRATIAADVKTIKELLAAGADASRRDRQGDSPLSYAVTHDLDDVVQVLRGAGVERLSHDKVIGHESMVHAGSQGTLGTILDLLDSGAPIDATDADGDTALTATAVHPGVVKVLAKRGADLSHRNNEGCTAYMIAVASNRIRMMQVLEKAGAPIDHPDQLDGMTEFHLMRTALDAASHEELIHLMDADEQTMIKTLREKVSGVDADISSNDPDVSSDGDELLMACLTGDALTVSKQVAAGIDVNYQNDEGRTPLMLALAGLGRGGMSRRRERDFVQIIDTLLVASADPDGGLMPPLILATLAGRLHIVNALIRAQANVNLTAELPTDAHEGTMLANALIVALSPNENDAHVDERIALALVQAGTDLLFTSGDGSMAVHCAAKAGMTKTLGEILDQALPAIDSQDNEGSTPLMLAASNNRLETIKVLLGRQANRQIRDAKEQTAADIALAAGNHEASSALSEA